MCRECGCGKGKGRKKTITVDRSINEANDLLGSRISHGLLHMGVLSVNIMGAPGSGKTTVIEELCKTIPKREVAVVQGDLESDVDMKRLKKKGIRTAQINTHSGCHLNATMVERALGELDMHGKRFLFIENVGNLVCPAGVNVGQHMNMVVSSTTEGSDKPRKYPIVFQEADLIVVSKCDLARQVGFDKKAYMRELVKISPNAMVVEASTKDSKGFRHAAHALEHAREHLMRGHHHH